VNSTGDVDAIDIGVIGGGGHVGLPLGIIFAGAGFSVTLIDQDEERLATVEDGEMPFREPGGERLLKDALQEGRLETTTDIAATETCDVLFVVIGTPIDEHHNPQMDNLTGLIDDMLPYLSEEQLIVLRSTVYPGTTSIVCDRLEEAGLRVGEDIFLSFAPERVTQHRAFEEIVGLPQLIGAPDDHSYEYTEAIFDTILESECLRLRPVEAELGKLFTNMWRYLNFAAANEFYLIAESFASHYELNIHRILSRTAQEYPRFDVPSPGTNVGGPCLTKDGWFLVDNIPYNELVSAAYQINEGMPSQIIDRMTRLSADPDTVAILGMTFKANSDDIRNSVSFKMEKQLQLKGLNDIVEIEPNTDGFDEWSDLEGVDWVILMTPHDEFSSIDTIDDAVDNEDCLYCDIWGLWNEMKYKSDNGYFFSREL
jgi:UDP-N-acetyl-D-mannosaminuronic acid dehydrogenase